MEPKNGDAYRGGTEGSSRKKPNLDIEKRFRKVKGYKHLPMLRKAIMKELNLGVHGKSDMKKAS